MVRAACMRRSAQYSLGVELVVTVERERLGVLVWPVALQKILVPGCQMEKNSNHMKLRNSLLALSLLSSALAGAPGDIVALTGGTVIDVENGHDIEDAVLLLEEDRIVAVGPRGSVSIPKEAKVVDVTGNFLVPGLIDGFASFNHQGYADAYLCSGVTSLISVSGGRRGGFFTSANPSPHIYQLESVGSEDATLAEMIGELDVMAAGGVRVALLMYELEGNEFKILADYADGLGLATIGECGKTLYADAARAGADAFVHTTRYSLDLAPNDMRAAVVAEPFSDSLDSAKWRWYLWLADHAAERERVIDYARILRGNGTHLIPTFGLLYLDQPFAKNPWHDPVSKFVVPSDINRPADSSTGKHTDDEPHTKAYARMAKAVMEIEASYVAEQVPHLAGSGTDVWGSMPGISLHQELECLVRVGMSPRQALASATCNFANAYGWDELGALRVGKRADVLVLSADPRASVENLRAIERLYLAGEGIDLEALHARDRKADGLIVRQDPVELPPETQAANEFAHLQGVELSSITYMSDGLRVEGYLAQPKEPGVYPCVIYNRGGNREFGALTDQRAARFLALMASWGYVAVASQYRGNAGGEGAEEFGGADVNDILALIPLLESLPAADASRIGMYGGSRGGMMTGVALSKTTRIGAAVMRCGLTDLVRWRVERPGIDTVYEEVIPGYDPEDDSTLIARSPALWVERLPKTTPILLMQGTSDWRVSPESTLAFASALQTAKHPYRLVMFEGADHSLNGFHAERNRLTREWLARYLAVDATLPDMEPHGD